MCNNTISFAFNGIGGSIKNSVKYGSFRKLSHLSNKTEISLIGFVEWKIAKISGGCIVGSQLAAVLASTSTWIFAMLKSRLVKMRGIEF